jgi:hypothetical protein
MEEQEHEIVIKTKETTKEWEIPIKTQRTLEEFKEIWSNEKELDIKSNEEETMIHFFKRVKLQRKKQKSKIWTIFE